MQPEPSDALEHLAGDRGAQDALLLLEAGDRERRHQRREVVEPAASQARAPTFAIATRPLRTSSRILRSRRRPLVLRARSRISSLPSESSHAGLMNASRSRPPWSPLAI